MIEIGPHLFDAISVICFTLVLWAFAYVVGKGIDK